MAQKRAPALTEADIPPPPPRLPDAPERSSFASQAAFDEAIADYQAAAARNEEQRKERRRMKEKLRDQNRDRSGRARPSDDGKKAAERRRSNPKAAANHREREAARYEAAQPEVTEADMALTSIVDHGEKRPNWEWLKGAKVSARARTKNTERKEAEQTERRRNPDKGVPDEVVIARLVEELVQKVVVRENFSDPSGRLYIEDYRLRDDFLEIMRYKAMDDQAYSMKDWARQPDPTSARDRYLVQVSERWHLYEEATMYWTDGHTTWGHETVQGELQAIGAWRAEHERLSYYSLIPLYLEHCVPRCIDAELTPQPRPQQWPRWNDDGTPVSLASWAVEAGRDQPGWRYPNNRPPPEVPWPREWWTFDDILLHCRCQAELSRACEPSPSPCHHGNSRRWECAACRSELVAEAVSLRFDGLDADASFRFDGFYMCGWEWLELRDDECQDYSDWRECGAVIETLVQQLERDAQRVRAAAAKAAAEAEAAAAAERAAAAAARAAEIGAARLAAAGLVRITEENALRFPPPKLFELNAARDDYVHVRRSDNGSAAFPDAFELDSAPMLWGLQMTGHLIHHRGYGEASEQDSKQYEALVLEWHKLARRRPPARKYGVDHRGRGGRSIYTMRELIRPRNPVRPQGMPDGMWAMHPWNPANQAPAPAPPLNDAAYKRKRGSEIEAQLEARRQERLREWYMARPADNPGRVRWEAAQARRATAQPPAAASDGRSDSEGSGDCDYDADDD